MTDNKRKGDQELEFQFIEQAGIRLLGRNGWQRLMMLAQSFQQEPAPPSRLAKAPVVSIPRPLDWDEDDLTPPLGTRLNIIKGER